MKNSVGNKVMNVAKEVYVKPTMEVYEMEMDTAILTGMDSTIPDGGLRGQGGAAINDFLGTDPSNFSKNA